LVSISTSGLSCWNRLCLLYSFRLNGRFCE
jgi:hypothetical protein